LRLALILLTCCPIPNKGRARYRYKKKCLKFMSEYTSLEVRA
jgi:hypothetical protein